MIQENNDIQTTDKYKRRSKHIIGIILLIPTFIILFTFILLPILRTFLRSFTDFNFVTNGKNVYLKNYLLTSSDGVGKIAITNTIITTLFQATIGVSLCLLFARLSSNLHRILKYVLCIMFIIVSITYIAPIGIKQIFSSSHNGYFNAFLLTRGKEIISFLEQPLFLRLIMVLLPILLGIGPLYLLFTVCYMNKDKLKKYIHLAISLQIVISFLSFESVKIVTGFPSVNYSAHNLNVHIYDYLMMRFEGGYGSALIIIMGLIILLFLLISNGVIWLVDFLLKSNNTKHPKKHPISTTHKKHSLPSIVIFIFLFLVTIILLYPFLQMCFDTFKPLNELYVFPTRIVATHPTISNYKNTLSQIVQANQGLPISTYVINSCITIILSTAIMLVVLIISGIGLSFFSLRIKKLLLLGITYTFVLCPIALISFNYSNYNSIIRLVLPLIFKSSSFGLSIYLGSKIFDKYINVYNKNNELLFSSNNIVKYLLGLLPISLLASLSAWFAPSYYLTSPDNMTLFQLFQRAHNFISTSGPNPIVEVCLLILSMIIPIGLVIVCVPFLLNSLKE